VKNRFQSLPFKCNLQRYIKVDREQLLQRNRALARQMVESQDRLDNTRWGSAG
jgi:hypothetical protein